MPVEHFWSVWDSRCDCKRGHYYRCVLWFMPGLFGNGTRQLGRKEFTYTRRTFASPLCS